MDSMTAWDRVPPGPDEPPVDDEYVDALADSEPAVPAVRPAQRASSNGKAEHVEVEVLRPFRRVPVDLTTDMPATPLLPPWLYGSGCLTVLQSEPGVGKSWLALWVAMRVIEAGWDVVYIDEEGGLELVHERLRNLGADPEAVAERFWYYAFESRTWGEEDLLALASMLAGVPRPGLAVLDSLPDFLAAAEFDEDRARDVVRFVKRVCGSFRDVGCSQLLLDHLPKPERGSKRERSRYSRGSGAKLGKADATLLLESEVEFDIRTNGKLRLWKTKDRRGRLELPHLGKPGRLLTVTVGGDRLGIEEVVGDGGDAPFRPTWLMEQVSQVLIRSTAPLSANAIRSVVPGRNTTKDQALELLVLEGYVRREKVGRGWMHTSVKPFLAPADEPPEGAGDDGDPWNEEF